MPRQLAKPGSDKKTPKDPTDVLGAEERDRKRAARASEGALYRPDFCMWFRDCVGEMPRTADYVWDRQLASAIGDGSESDRNLRRYYGGESKHPGAASAYAIGWAFHDVGLTWCSGPLALLVGGHAARFFKLLAYLASYGAPSREAALIYAFGSVKANAPIKALDRSIVEPTRFSQHKGFYVRGQLEARRYARNAVRVAARQRDSIGAAWTESGKPGALRKTPGDFRYAYETVSSKAAVSQEARIAGALVMIAAAINDDDNDREAKILRKLRLLSPMATLNKLLNLESEIKNHGG
jgi:hypothetical protein